MCRTCGEAFSTSTKRDKHTLSNACTKSIIERKHVCSVCKRRFQSRKTFITHESWCKYKKRRVEKEIERGDNSNSVTMAGDDMEEEPATTSGAAAAGALYTRTNSVRCLDCRLCHAVFVLWL